MTTKPIYLDHAATTPLLAAARDAMREGFAIWANPSSPHRQGRAARSALEDARDRVKKALKWDGELVFTSGASEALSIALTRCRLPLSACSAVEHDAVLRHAGQAERIGVQVGQGQLARFEPAAACGLVAVQHANNETGVLQNLDPVAATVRDAGGLLLADCAQTAGKIELPVADLVAVSAHKFGGPVGIGALLIGDWTMLTPSGGQERGYRGGTENLPGAMAMAAALEAGHDWMARATTLRARLEAAIVRAGGHVVASQAQRIATVGSYRMPRVKARVQLIKFDSMGIAISAGSACSSGSLSISHVLQAMGVEGVDEVVRISIGRETSENDIDRFIAAWTEVAIRGSTAA